MTYDRNSSDNNLVIRASTANTDFESRIYKDIAQQQQQQQQHHHHHHHHQHRRQIKRQTIDNDNDSNFLSSTMSAKNAPAFVNINRLHLFTLTFTFYWY